MDVVFVVDQDLLALFINYCGEMDQSNQQQWDDGQQPGIVYEGGKKGRIFVLNYGSEMFVGNGFRFRMALQAVRNQISDICCMGDSGEMCAMVFANTERTNDKAENIDNMFVFREMGTMDAEFVKGLDAILSQDDIRCPLDTFMGGSGVCNWAELLYLCQKLLRYSGHQFRKKFIHIFTTDQQGMSSKTTDQMRSRLTEIGNAGIDVSVFLMDDPDIPPDERSGRRSTAMSDFWAEVDPMLSRFSSPAELQSGLRLKNYALRSTTSLPVKMGDNFEFAVGLYYLIKPQGKPPAIMMDSETGERVEQRVHYIVAPLDGEAQTAEGGGKEEPPPGMVVDEVFEGELGFSREVGGVEVVLSRAELEKLRRLEKPGIVVIGFKPLHLLKDSHRMGAAVFVYPIETVISGSSAVYRALLQRCLDKQLFILVRYTHKTNTPPKLCALIPQSADQIPNGCTLAREYFYDGFHLVEIPFAENARSMEKRFLPPEGGVGTWPSATPEQVEAAKQFIRKLINAKFSPDDFANPVLQQHYKAVELVALDLPFDSDQFKREAFENDKLIPYFKNPTFEQRVAVELEEFGSVCESNAETKGRKAKKNVRTERGNEEEGEEGGGSSRGRRGRSAAGRK